MAAGYSIIIRREFIWLSGLWILILSLCHAQSHMDHKGTYFVTSFSALNSSMAPQLLIISQGHCNVEVTIRTPNWHVMEPIYMNLTSENGTRFVPLPREVRMDPNQISNKGIEISSTHDIAVYSLNSSPNSRDATLVLPSDALGDQYIMTSYQPHVECVTKASIVSTQDRTLIQVYLPKNETNTSIQYLNTVYTNNDVFEIRLNAFETVQLNSFGDISGIILTANKTFALTFGSTYVEKCNETNHIISDFNHTHGHIEEQVIPSRAWGKIFIAIPFGSYDNSDVIRIVASCDDTILLISTDTSNYTYTLDACDTLTFSNTNNSAYIAVKATEPIAMLQYYCAEPENESDFLLRETECLPYLVTIPPAEQDEHEYLFSTGDTQQLITLVIDSIHAPGLLLDGAFAHEHSDMWLPVMAQGHNNYTAIRLRVQSGYHNISNSNRSAVFSAISQSSPIGLRLANINYYTAVNRPNSTIFEVTVQERSGNNVHSAENNEEEDDYGIHSNIIAVIVTLGSAVFFVIVCILGFVLNETVCKDGCPLTSNKIAPYVT